MLFLRTNENDFNAYITGKGGGGGGGWGGGGFKRTKVFWESKYVDRIQETWLVFSKTFGTNFIAKTLLEL